MPYGHLTESGINVKYRPGRMKSYGEGPGGAGFNTRFVPVIGGGPPPPTPPTPPTLVNSITTLANIGVIGAQIVDIGFTPTVGNSLLVLYGAAAGDINGVTLAGVSAWNHNESRDSSNSPFLGLSSFWGDVTSASAHLLTLTLNGAFTTNGYVCGVFEFSGIAGKVPLVANQQSASTVTATPTNTNLDSTGAGDIVVSAYLAQGTNADPWNSSTDDLIPTDATWLNADVHATSNPGDNLGILTRITQCHEAGDMCNNSPTLVSPPGALDTIGLAVLIG